MTIELPRRGFLLGVGALLAAPALVRASSLMDIKGERMVMYRNYLMPSIFSSDTTERWRFDVFANVWLPIEKAPFGSDLAHHWFRKAGYELPPNAPMNGFADHYGMPTDWTARNARHSWTE